MDLGDDGDVRAGVECLDRGAHARATRADDQDVVPCLHRRSTLPQRAGTAPRYERRDRA